jgi:hypothetical protein
VTQDGVELLAIGISKFITDLAKAGGTYDDLIVKLTKGEKMTEKATEKTSSAFSRLAKGFGVGATEALGLNTAVAALSGGLVGVGAAVGSVAVGIGKTLVESVKRATSALAGLAQQAADVEGLGIGFKGFAQDAEGGADAMLAALEKGSAGMIAQRDLMGSFNRAASLVNKDFAQRLPEAFEALGKVSFTTGTSFQFLLDSLIWGVGRLTPKVIDNLQVQTNLAEITARGAEMFGKQAEALSITDKQMAAMDVTMEKLLDNTSAIPDISDRASVQSAKLGASLTNIGDTIGSALLPAWSSLLTSANMLVDTFAAAIAEGGSLRGVLVGLGAALSIMADSLAAGVQWFVDFVEGGKRELGTGLLDISSNMLEWGFEIVASFAEGMVDAASSVLVSAINMIGRAIEEGVSPGSPPKVSPKLDEWGVDAMSSFLQGMTNADFDVLKAVQGPLKKILEDEDFANVSKGLIESLGGGDEQGFLDQLQGSAGAFGMELRRLAELNMAVAKSVQDVQEAEEALAQSREGITDAQKEIAKLRGEYNALLRQGAGDETLNVSLERINAAEKELEIARLAEMTAKEGLETAKERVDVTKEEEGKQKNVVDQLLGLNAALEEEDKLEKQAKKRKGKPTIAGREPFGFGKIDIGSKIGEQIEAAKDAIKERAKGLFKPLTDAWDSIKLTISGLGTAWDKFVLIVGGAWDTLKKKYPVLQDIETWISNMLSDTSLPALVTEIGTNLLKAITDVWDFMKKFFTPIFEGIGDVFDSLLEKSFELFLLWFEDLLSELNEIWTFLKDTLMPFWEDPVKPFFEEFVGGLKDGLTSIQTMAETIGGLLRGLASAIDNFDMAKLWALIGRSPAPLAVGLASINKELKVMKALNMPGIIGGSGRMNFGMRNFQPMRQNPINVNVSAPSGMDGRMGNMQLGPNTFTEPFRDAQMAAGVRRIIRRRG